ncbi:acyl-CoA synthetase [Streptomyces durbertensis]|uniref:Acyl-CoA synthetase n=1 Tax=Streptomyces durbertensis TaxID=2448886 RepID=A0ABR6EDZ3_9ACTN|nr:AMP-binding protein [Streptomyces durbertensis]MBB1243388.1 acyl-CoA synthetase [Streptomyces durbertensis]
MSSLLPALETEPAKTAVRFGDQTLDYTALSTAARHLALGIGGRAARVAVWATPTAQTAVSLVAGLLAGVPVIPLNPRSGERELAHIVADSTPGLVLAAEGDELPEPLAGLPRIDTRLHVPEEDGAGRQVPLQPSASAGPALIVYTSGTTGAPKGVVLSQRALAATLDDLAAVWEWTADDVLVHALPLFHVHGLVLGLIGPLRRGGTLHHLGAFSTEAVTTSLTGGGTMLFGVPTMYHRLALALDDDPELVAALRGARLLVSGSAALPLPDHQRITAATGQHVVERYGMTETLMNTSVPANGPHKPGTVGLPLPGVDVRLVDDDGNRVEGGDGETIGEVQVRGPQLFTEYLGKPDATAAAFAGGWFRTGDMATRDADGYYRLVGRKSTDLIKSGGYKIGAGEIENALLDHPGVSEAAVTGEPDPDLGERVIAWVAPTDLENPVEAQELIDHVASQLAPHKRPREVRFRESLPRNHMGKILKRELS